MRTDGYIFRCVDGCSGHMREEGIQTQTAYTDSRMITYTYMRAICVGACLALCRNYECNCRLLLLLFVLLCLHALIMSVPEAWKAEAFRATTKRECPRAARQALVRPKNSGISLSRDSRSTAFTGTKKVVVTGPNPMAESAKFQCQQPKTSAECTRTLPFSLPKNLS